MQTTYKFKLRPNLTQHNAFVRDQRNACYVKNRMLGDREQTYHTQSVLGDYCALHNKQTYTVSALRCDLETRAIGSGLQCSINRNVTLGDPWKTGKASLSRPKKSKSSDKPSKPPSLKRTAYEMQSSALPQLKSVKPELKATSATALQNACKQVDTAFSRFFSGIAKHPTYKRSREVGINYPDGECKVDAATEKIYFPGVGWMRFFNSRSFWEGMKLSKFTVTREVDDWYVSVLVKDATIPDPVEIAPEAVETVVGGDKGIKKLLSVSGQATFQNPQFLKAEERRLAIRQRRVSRKKKGSKNRSKAGKRVAKLHQSIRRKRDDYQWKVAHQFTNLADANGIEDLNVSGMMKRCRPKQDGSGTFTKNGQSAKSQLNKAISDASWHGLDQKIKHQSKKKGKLCIPVEPRFTSQECPKCHHIDASNRDGEKFICTNCGHVDDADNNAGTNIAQKAIRTAQLNTQTVRVVSPEFTPQIRLRRNHQQRLVSLGRRTNQPNKLRHAERIVLNSWIWGSTVRSDSKTLTSVRS